ncbi:MAG TPA: DUF222 domain-containing protein [Acidimicrobiales bacterium]
MFPSVIEAKRVLEAFVASFDPSLVSILDCTDLVEEFAAIERLAAAGKVLAARRVPEGASWRVDGDRSPAAWLARKTGSSLPDAASVLATARQLPELPATEAALRAGKLSGVQVRDVADAASVAPAAEGLLLQTAEREGVGALRTKARAIKVAGSDDAQRYRRIHAGRYIRFFTDDEGAFCGRFRTTPDHGARLLAGLQPFQDEAFRAARKAGRLDGPQAHAIDGLLAMAQAAHDHLTGHGADPASQPDIVNPADNGNGNGIPAGRDRTPRARRSLGSQVKVIYNVTYEAIVRGHALEGETCELVGVGPVPVTAVKAAMNDAFIAGVLTKGVDIAAVAHLGRKATALQQTAMEFRNPACDVLGCDNHVGVQIDHDTGWAKTHQTKLDDLNKLCPYHHWLKTRFDYKLEPGTGKRHLLPPANPPPPNAYTRRAARPGPPPSPDGRGRQPPDRAGDSHVRPDPGPRGEPAEPVGLDGPRQLRLAEP